MRHFTYDWFSYNIPYWDVILDNVKPSKILEVGSFEGMSTCFMIDRISPQRPVEIYCIDSWEGGIEHASFDMKQHEKSFHHNINHAVRGAPYPATIQKRKGNSLVELSKLVVEGVRDFDLVYIDGSHKTCDVFVDAALSFNLLRVGGILIFDDYLHNPGGDRTFEQEQYEHPKNAIDSFILCFANKLEYTQFNMDEKEVDQKDLYQMYLKKVAE